MKSLVHSHGTLNNRLNVSNLVIYMGLGKSFKKISIVTVN